MSNMSYCRFRNTVQDLRDCQDNLETFLDPKHDREEIDARLRLVKICREIAECYEDCETEQELEEFLIANQESDPNEDDED